MYLKSFTAKNLKCLRDVSLNFPSEGGYAGWCVITGENGTGKTTLLQGIAASVMVGEMCFRFGDGVVTHGVEGRAHMTATTSKGKVCTVAYPWTLQERRPKTSKLPLGYKMSGLNTNARHDFGRTLPTCDTLFETKTSLRSCEYRLVDLYSRHIDPKDEVSYQSDTYPSVLRAMTRLASSFDVSSIDVNSKSVTFNDPGVELSMSLQRLMAVAIDIMLNLISTKGSLDVDADGRVRGQALVLLDDVGHDMHPRWQRHLADSLCDVFPDVQFIVTTHCPFVAQAARPGGLFTLSHERDNIVLTQPVQSTAGMTSDQLSTSPVFGLSSTRDLVVGDALQEWEALDSKSDHDEDEDRRHAELDEFLSKKMPQFDDHKLMGRAWRLLRQAVKPS